MLFDRQKELFKRISIRYSIFIYFTVTAGVSTPSASSAAPPNMAGMTKYLP